MRPKGALNLGGLKFAKFAKPTKTILLPKKSFHLKIEFMKTSKTLLLLTSILTLMTLTSCNSDADEPKFTGYDMKGEKQSCPPMKEEFACTMMMAPSDFFGMQCREMGHKAFQCGCHYWLCDKKIKFEQNNP